MKVYHENGKISQEGKWVRTLKDSGRPTNVKDGQWLYYNKLGKLEKTEFYKNEQLKETKKEKD